MIQKAMLALRLAGQDLRGNAGVHAVAVGVIAAAFLAAGLFVMLAANLQALAGHWEEKVRIVVYLADHEGAPEEKRAEAKPELIGPRLRALPGVDSAEYLGRDEALAEFRKALGPDAALLDGLEGNPLPSSFTLALEPGSREVGRVEDMAAEISSWPGVGEVDYGGDWLRTMGNVLAFVRAAIYLAGALIAVASVFIISNTVRLAMYSRREEIGIMKLVGADNLLIRAPFVIEGMLQGALAAVLGVALLYALHGALVPGLDWSGVLEGFTPVFVPARVAVLMVAGGAALGAAASMGRFSSFLKV